MHFRSLCCFKKKYTRGVVCSCPCLTANRWTKIIPGARSQQSWTHMIVWLVDWDKLGSIKEWLHKPGRGWFFQVFAASCTDSLILGVRNFLRLYIKPPEDIWGLIILKKRDERWFILFNVGFSTASHNMMHKLNMRSLQKLAIKYFFHPFHYFEPSKATSQLATRKCPLLEKCALSCSVHVQPIQSCSTLRTLAACVR